MNLSPLSSQDRFAARDGLSERPRAAGPVGTRPARVLHVITMLELGGAQRNTLYTCAHLDRARFTPLLACGPGGYLDEEARSSSGYETLFVPALVRAIRPHKDAAALLSLARLIARVRPDIVHTHSSKAGLLGRWAAKLAGVPRIVHSIHGFPFHAGQNPAVRAAYVAAERATARITTRFIAVSHANRIEAQALAIFDAGRCAMIRSGVELARFREAARGAGSFRKELGIPPDQPLVGMVACLKPQKAPLDFVDVARRVLEEAPGATLVLVGDGELRGAVEAAASEIPGGSDRIRILGWRTDTDRIIADLDVLLLTSRWEGLPRVIPEAMAAGRPVVATAVDGSPEAVEDGVNGFLAPPGDTPLLARRVLDLLANRDLRDRMGEAGRRRAGEWDIDAMVRAQEDLYTEILAAT